MVLEFTFLSYLGGYMTLNFPDRFPVQTLSRFKFGSADAFRDKLLLDTFCFTHAAKFSRENDKNFILGPPGSGKSALFKAYKEGILTPKDCGEKKFLIIGVSDELRYLDVEQVISEKFDCFKYPEKDKYILLWDAYIVFKIIQKLKNSFGFSLKNEIKKFSFIFNEFDTEEFSFDGFIGKLQDISLQIRWKFGGFLISGKTNSQKKKENPIIIDLVTLKRKINSILEKEKIFIWVMIDKLDDFVLGKDFDVQKKLITSLINCESRYSDCSRVFLKIFMRDDLLRRVAPDIEQNDKMDERIITLEWTDIEIRRFMARRLIHNYMSILNFDPAPLFKNGEVENEDRDLREMVKTNFKDKISKKMILTVFPRKPFHKTIENEKQDIDFCSFFNTHFKLSRKTYSPRVMIRFLQLSFEKAHEYYQDNPGEDRKVKRDKNQEFPLIKKECMYNAYKTVVKKTKNWTLDKARRYDHVWDEILSLYFNDLNKAQQFTLNDFCTKLDILVDEARTIMAFLENVGAVGCSKSNRKNWGESEYTPSLFYRAVSYHMEWELEKY